MIDALIAVLESMAQMTEQLSDLIQAERLALVGGDADNLAACVTEKESLLGRLRYFDGRRKAEMASAARGLGTDGGREDSGRDGLRRIIGQTPEPDRTRLVLALQKLNDLTRSAKRANQANALMSEAALRRIGGLADLLKGMMPTQSVYQATGRWKEVAVVHSRTLGRG